MGVFFGSKKYKLNLGEVRFWMMQSGRIPSEYQEVEWIAAAANVGAYIDLGFSFDKACEIYMSQWIYAIGTTAYPFGAAENSGVLRCLLSSPYSSAASFYGSSGTAYGSSSVAITGDATSGSKNELKMIAKRGARSIENLTSGATSGSSAGQGEFTMTNNLYLFAQNYNGSARWGSGIRQIGYFKYYDKNGDLICDLVPCYRKSDGVIGMYDVVRDMFLTNVGSGSFTKGADI